ncbi:MAG TPA: sigma-70 family RNA polymerase sigma factor [Chitinophagaceae bacterium]|mgnify:CR=1 FL=1|nr:sigma-70 family RNA polymerase sigma factor [Chitinophagaceae bacterium]
MKAPINETILLQGLAKNDTQAVETIYRENYGMVQSLIINNNGSADDAKDVFQETMIVLYEKTRSGQLELHCQIKTYIYSVARRIWLKKLQQASRYAGDIGNPENIIPVEDDLEEHERRDREFQLMDKAISGLGEPCKSLLEAFYIKKQQMQEIAQNFGYTNAENAKTQKYKCLMRLKKIFFSQYKNGQ